MTTYIATVGQLRAELEDFDEADPIVVIVDTDVAECDLTEDALVIDQCATTGCETNGCAIVLRAATNKTAGVALAVIDGGQKT